MWTRTIAIAGMIATLGFAVCAEAAEAEIGWIKSVAGEAHVVRGDAREAATLGQPVHEGDRLETGPDGSIGVTFTDNTVMSAGPNSSVVLENYRYDAAAFEGNMLTELQKGTLAVTTGDIPRTSPEAMRVRTPAAVLGVRGTRFLVKASGAGKGS
ncbi:MAG: FecR domain-containing protein [Alphaproteobacteria bacterium]